LETVSLDDNHNICGIYNPYPCGNIDRIKKIIQISFFGSPIYINDSTYSTYTNIDVIIILSTKISRSYMTTDSTFPFKKNVDQPVHIICIPEDRNWPYGKSVTEHLKSALPGMYND